MQQDDLTKREIASRAGVPGVSLTGAFGQQIKHNAQIENEMLINQTNPIQYSLKVYTHELKKSTNTQKQDDGSAEKPGGLKNLSNQLKAANDESRATTKKKAKEIKRYKQEMFDDPLDVQKRTAAINESKQGGGYMVGTTKKFGDEMGMHLPERYIQITQNERWLESRAKLTEQQKID